MRLAYVAATRARELLVVPVVGDGPHEDGLVLRPERRPLSAERCATAGPPGAGLPPFGADSVRDWPDTAMRDPELSVRPGAHAPKVGDHEVVWWDPRALDLDRQDEVGLRQQKMLSEDEKGEARRTRKASACMPRGRRACPGRSSRAP